MPRLTWQEAWRGGVARVLSTQELEILATALRDDDPRLIQDNTTSPPPLICVQDWPVEGACVLGFCGWQSTGLITVGEVEEFFATVCFEADQLLGEVAACRSFLDFADETPRDEMRRDLLVEVERELASRC